MKLTNLDDFPFHEKSKYIRRNNQHLENMNHEFNNEIFLVGNHCIPYSIKAMVSVSSYKIFTFIYNEFPSLYIFNGLPITTTHPTGNPCTLTRDGHIALL